MQGLFVINRDFFTWLDIAQSKEQDVSVQILHVSVRLAAVIDVVRAVAAAAAVQTPTTVDVANAKNSSIAAASGRFKVRDALPCVFGDLFSALEEFGGETALAVDSRFPDRKARCKIEFHQRQCSGRIILEH